MAKRRRRVAFLRGIFNCSVWEALVLHAGSLAKQGRALPVPRTVSALKGDPAVAADLRDHALALIALREPAADAAE